LSVLHVTNGDSAVDALRAAGIDGAFLPWRDVLHDGPVPGDLDFDALADARAAFIAGAGWGTPTETLRGFRERDRCLADPAYRSIVLWFEHDLYDQLQLIQILSRLRGAGDQTLDLVCEARYVAEQPPATLHDMHDRRVPITEEHIEPAVRAWRAFRSMEPGDLETAARTPVAALPFLAPALGRQLEEYPDAEAGLARSERQILRCLADAEDAKGDTALTAAALFRATQRLESARFMGDGSFWSWLAGLAAGDTPLLQLSTGEPVQTPGRDDFLASVRLTEAGRAVLRGEADRVRLLGLDRWIGGVHLVDEHHWRWNHGAGRLERRAT
jgi:hypothetical protein